MASDHEIAALRVTGADEAAAMLKNLQPQLRDRCVMGALRSGARVTANTVREMIPVRQDARPRQIMGKAVMPGALKKSVRVAAPKKAQSYDWARASVLVGNKTAWYAHIVDGGAKPHDIKPKTKKALFFGGTRKKIVNHPGFAGKNILKTSAQVSFSAAVNAVKKAFDRLVKKLETKQ